MNKPLLAAAAVVVGGCLHAQTVLYVAPAGNSDGSSWKEPTNLHAALAAARAGDVVFVKTGTYLTSEGGDRTASFSPAEGVRMLGGFRGDEPDEHHRDPISFETVLSGEIGSPERGDNAYTVLRLTGSGEGTVVDGFTITGGYADGAGGAADARRAGGGILIEVSEPGGRAAPRIADCVLAGNYARDGGGAYVSGRAGSAAPHFEDCTFRDNEADLDGGAVYVDGRRRGDAAPLLTDCLFQRNVANYGGALFNQATGGRVVASLTRCHFTGNRAYVRGATLYSIDHRGSAEARLEDCVFDEPAGVRQPEPTPLARAVD